MQNSRLLLLLSLVAWMPYQATAQRVVADINVRGASSNPVQVTALANRLFFVAPDRAGEDALWFSDGTLGSEQRIEMPERPRIRAADDEWIYVEARSDGFGSSLWVTNGEESHLVDERGFIRFLGRTPRGMVFGDSVDNELYVVVDGRKVVLLADTERTYRDGIEADGELLITAVSSGLSQVWKTDGTAENTRLVYWGHIGYTGAGIHFRGRDLFVGIREEFGWQLIDIPGDFSDPVALTDVPGAPRDMVESGGRLFFTVQVDGGVWIYSTQGTVKGARRILGPESSWTPDLQVWAPLRNGVVFSARHPNYGTELLFTDGEAISLLADIYPGEEGSSPRLVASDSQVIYFGADDARGRELWVTDGTAEGTRLLADVSPGPDSAKPDRGTLSEDAVCFPAETPTTGREVWCVHRTAGEAWLGADLRVGGTDPSNPERLYSWDGRVVFEADDGEGGRQVWTTDGTASGTRPATALPAGRRTGYFYDDRVWVESGEDLYFADFGGLHRLNRDGTAEPFGPAWIQPADLEVIDGRVFTSIAPGASQQPGLVWLPVSDGKEALPHRIRMPDGPTVHPGNLYRVGQSVLWFGEDGYGNSALWSADTEAARVLWGVATNGGGITSAVEHDGHLFFTVRKESRESLWVTDGSQDGSRPVWTGLGGAAYGVTAFKGGLLFFGEVDYDGGLPLFHNPQTGETTLLGVPGRTSASDEQRWVVAGPHLAYFNAHREIWRSDGTASGTWRVARLDGFLTLLGLSGTKVLFSYDDGLHGVELWAADEGGVRLVSDFNPGPISSNPGPVVQLGDKVVFAADNPYLGRELHIIDAADISTGIDHESDGEVSVAPLPYPNPASDWVIQPLGADWDGARVEVFDILGRRLAQPADGTLSRPQVRFSVAGWAPGVYLIRIDGPGGRRHHRFTVRR